MNKNTLLKTAFFLVNLSFVGLIHTPPETEPERTEEKFFLPDRLKKINGILCSR